MHDTEIQTLAVISTRDVNGRPGLKIHPWDSEIQSRSRISQNRNQPWINLATLAWLLSTATTAIKERSLLIATSPTSYDYTDMVMRCGPFANTVAVTGGAGGRGNCRTPLWICSSRSVTPAESLMNCNLSTWGALFHSDLTSWWLPWPEWAYIIM